MEGEGGGTGAVGVVVKEAGTWGAVCSGSSSEGGRDVGGSVHGSSSSSRWHCADSF